MPETPQQIRDTLLKAGRAAGERYVQVRGVDLEAALTDTKPESNPTPSASRKPSDPKDD